MVGVVGALTGCATTQVLDPEMDQHGRVYYLDGAGGGGVLVNWGRRVHKGLRRAGLKGSFCDCSWHTGLGVAADQAASAEYKRSQAQRVAESIYEYKTEYADRPVSIIGFSAGTAVTIYAVEALPQGCFVDDVVLLASSMSADYDLTDALGHVRNGVHVVTSEGDAVLRWLVPLAGTADRRFRGDSVAGLYGFSLPADASDDTRSLYRKLAHIRWEPQFAQSGNHGGHTEVTNPDFIRRRVAVLLRGEREVASARASSEPDLAAAGK